MRPENFTGYPWGSILQNSQSETIAQNIMKILKRTGNKFRTLSFEEYKSERIKDGSFTNSEETYFNDVIKYCSDPKSASLFCNKWSKNSYLRPKTKGELLEALKKNIKCEVDTKCKETTSCILMENLGFDNFKTYPSKNEGWTIYEKNIV
jgi:hypothetical protein